jgi:Putative polyhydroxyalkanoic acid system protein (PHA_gran_rgn)
MRLTIKHNKPLEQVKTAVDHSMGQVFNSLGSGIVEFTDNHRQWHGDTMAFSMTARMGFIKTPIKGTIAVTASDITVDVDLGMLEKLLPQETVRAGIEGQVRGLLT